MPCPVDTLTWNTVLLPKFQYLGGKYWTAEHAKKSAIEAIGLHLLQTTRNKLATDQKLVLGGCFSSAYTISSENLVPQEEQNYASDALEADLRIWRHASVCPGQNILILSPDTDVYNIGLGLACTLTKHILVQINPPGQASQFVDMQQLRYGIQIDSELIWLEVFGIIRSLFVTTGSDYTSYFHGFGKKTVLDTFFHYCDFITGSSGNGSLHQVSVTNQHRGFLSFLRLVGALYFKKHYSAFYSRYGHELPDHLLKSITAEDAEEKHHIFIDGIRSVVNERVSAEDDKVPSTTALWRHWLRSCWVSQMWQNSCQHEVYKSLPPPQQNGWHLDKGGGYSIDWESEEVTARVKDVVDFLTRGCSCKKNCCESSRCGCKRNKKHCGPGCECVMCKNLPAPPVSISTTDNDNIDDDTTQETSAEEDTSEDDITTEIITQPRECQIDIT